MAKLDLIVTTIVKGEQQLKGLSQDLGKADTGFAKLGRSLGGFVTPATLAVGSAVAVGTALVGAAQAAIDEEKGIAALTAALKANDPAAANHIDQIEQVIRQRENLAFADDEQRESLARLVGVTKDTTKALSLQRTAMDLARLRGLSLAAASDLVGKVYGGNLGILTRYGIQLEKGTTATEALAEIQRRAAGQAQAFAQTTTGAVESMGIVWGDLSEDLGQILLPVIRDIALFVRDDLIPALREAGPAIGEFFGFLGENVVGPIVKGIQMVGDAVGFVLDVAQGVREFFGDFSESNKEAWTEAQHDQSDFVKKSASNWEAYQGILSQAAESTATAAETIAQIPVDEIEDHWDEVRSAAFETTIQYQLGILDGQNEVKEGMEVLRRLQEEEMTKTQEIAFLKGQLTSEELASGLNDDRTGVRNAAQALRAEIIAKLASLGVDAYNSGLSVPSNLAAGMYANSHLLDGASSYLAAKISGYLPRSNAEVGPLSDIESVGGAIVRSITDGIYADIGRADLAASALAGSLAVTPTTTAGLIGLPGASGGLSEGVTINIHVNGAIDEEALPGIMSQAVFVAGLEEDMGIA